VRTGVTVAFISEHPEGALVELTDGSRTSVDLVVGADGVHSRIRELVFLDAPPPRFTGHAVWRAMVPRPEHAPPGYEQGTLHMFYSSTNKAGTLPVGASEMYVFLVQSTPERMRHADDELPPPCASSSRSTRDCSGSCASAL
jgi:2-polyprenyl-6-methoxyphenol hydroxylase-like FAD-dependent oxidoreductase